MTLPYFWRLLFLCAAAFFLVHTIAALASRLFSPAAIKMAGRLRPRSAAQFLLALRLAPSTLAIFAVLGLCIPSYLSFEPGATREEVGFICIAATILTAALFTISLARGIRAIVNTTSYGRACLKLGAQFQTSSVSSPLIVLDDAKPLVATVGVIRQRFVISRAVLETLSPEELDCAVQHERSHRISADNFKRLLLLLAPDVLPFVSGGFSALDHAWITFSEWAADDFAVANDQQRSLELAGALVRVAQMGAAPPLSPLCTALVSGNSACMGQDLAVRVDRLLQTASLREEAPKRFRSVLAVASIAMACGFFVLLLQPGTLNSVHRFLEVLTH